MTDNLKNIVKFFENKKLNHSLQLNIRTNNMSYNYTIGTFFRMNFTEKDELFWLVQGIKAPTLEEALRIFYVKRPPSIYIEDIKKYTWEVIKAKNIEATETDYHPLTYIPEDREALWYRFPAVFGSSDYSYKSAKHFYPALLDLINNYKGETIIFIGGGPMAIETCLINDSAFTGTVYNYDEYCEGPTPVFKNEIKFKNIRRDPWHIKKEGVLLIACNAIANLEYKLKNFDIQEPIWLYASNYESFTEKPHLLGNSIKYDAEKKLFRI